MSNHATGPLAGIRVLDLTMMVSGPISTMMLGDQGADVIKIESPAGDHMRNAGVIYKGMSAYFLSCNRSKRSLCVDIKTEEGLAIVRKLVKTADVLVQNFRPGAIERMGLGEDAVREINPDIIFVSISGFGETGPYSHQRVYDPVIQALCGICDIQTDQETGRPHMVRTIIPDKTTSVTAAQAITAALFARERTGKGQHIRLAMLDTMVAYLWPESSSPMSFVGNEQDPANQQSGPDLIFATADGYITAGAVSDAEWSGMCRAFKREDLIDDPRFANAAARNVNRDARREIMNEEIVKWPSAEILARLDAETVPAAPVLTRTEVLEDPQVIRNRIIKIHDDPVLGPVRQPKPAAEFSKTPAAVRGLAPYLGADNAEILSEIGYDATEVERLSGAGVLKQRPAPG